ncbi:thiamine ABC transporter substrate-binding protein [Nocardioides aequoreus]|uniref:thiamine ABC transporter substrate-binding protein n=1 Tax=Nocardioides aequoreus TaxID=397278 RepID=UPI00055F321E|nr:thiamine ABC transporter substrate-binding protein [Nocardioides aequoreus]
MRRPFVLTPRPHHRPRRGTPLRALAAVPVLALVVTACGSSAGDDAAAEADTITLATHDSWAMPEEVLDAFRDETGIEVVVQPQGDAGTLTNKLVLTRDNPLADGVYGIDNTFGSRAVDEGVLAPYDAALPEEAEQYRLPGGERELTPVDFGDVCVNYDRTWFEEEGLEPPRSLDDLLDPAYADLFVTPGAATSSPGLAFLLATVAAEGDDWPAYWEALVDNGAKVTAGWSDAYEVDFTAGGGGGDRPLVLSYSSSPPFTVPEGGDEPTTAALLDTCYRQVEYAGVLEGAANPEGMQQLIDFMVGEQFQEALPDNMYVYPVTDVALPEAWAEHAPTAETPYAVDPAEVAANREGWVREWRDLVSR